MIHLPFAVIHVPKYYNFCLKKKKISEQLFNVLMYFGHTIPVPIFLYTNRHSVNDVIDLAATALTFPGPFSRCPS